MKNCKECKNNFNQGSWFGFFCGAIVWAIPFLGIGECIGHRNAIIDLKHKAIKADYAHYHPKTGFVTWDKCKELKP